MSYRTATRYINLGLAALSGFFFMIENYDLAIYVGLVVIIRVGWAIEDAIRGES